MESLKKIMFAALIPGIIVEFYVIIKDFLPEDWRIRAIAAVIFYLAFVALFYLLDAIWNGWFKARFNLWYVGKIRGLWAKRGLVKKIEKNFYSSSDIKIKVTRGIDLLKESNKYGFTRILDNLKNGKGIKHDSEVSVKFLLILPCLKEEHVKIRYERHNTMTEEQYLETWYQFLQKIRTYNTENLSINVRFYFDSHARWRFYIFSKSNGNNTTVLLSDYDKKRGGSSQPMYEIIQKNENIGTFMSKYFEELWSTSITPKELHHQIASGACQSHFCKKCTQKKSDKCSYCGEDICEFRDMCKRLVAKYESELLSFNAGK